MRDLGNLDDDGHPAKHAVQTPAVADRTPSPTTSSPQVVNESPTVSETTPNTIPAKSSATPPPSPFAVKNPWVDFEVKEGWAVTQKDILLGKPKEENKNLTGKHYPARTKLWPTYEIP